MISEATQQLGDLRNNYSVHQLADEIGTSHEMIRRWLRGESQPRVDYAGRIAELFYIIVKPRQSS